MSAATVPAFEDEDIDLREAPRSTRSAAIGSAPDEILCSAKSAVTSGIEPWSLTAERKSLASLPRAPAAERRKSTYGEANKALAAALVETLTASPWVTLAPAMLAPSIRLSAPTRPVATASYYVHIVSDMSMWVGSERLASYPNIEVLELPSAAVPDPNHDTLAAIAASEDEAQAAHDEDLDRHRNARRFVRE